jgi:hypothetical protein
MMQSRLNSYSQPAGMRQRDPRAALRRALSISRPLTIAGLTMLLVLAGTLVGLLLDPRVITGAPAWLKPAKFAISISIYSFTLIWLLGFVQGRPRLVRLVANVTTIALVVEMALIATQAARGTTSHFNVATPLDGAIFSTMGILIIAAWAMNLLAAVLLIRQRLPDPAYAWALRLGLLLTLVGAAIGFLMVTPTSAQLAGAAAGQGMTIAGAHSVGVADGGPGLPLVGWSATGGDLRVPHFVGLHALQALPLLGWLLALPWARRLGARHRLALVWIAGLSYLGLIGLLTWQALRGQPLIAPDTLTLAALGGLLGATALAAAAALAHAKRSNAAAPPLAFEQG